MNRKTVKRLFLSLVCLIPFAVSAETATVGDFTWTYTLNEDGTATIGPQDNGGGGSTNGRPAVSPTPTGELVIPSELAGIRVTRIGREAFNGCDALTSVIIPEGITFIGYHAFFNCSSLASVVIPEGVTTIRDAAFYGCSKLSSVTLPKSLTSIEYHAFYGCSSLTSVVIPSSVTSIGIYAFSGCSSLTSVTIPSSVTSIEERAFNGCSSLTSVTIPEGVTSIGGSAFRDCSSLTSVTIPEGVTSIRGYAFYGCSSLTSVTIPEGVTSIGYNAFEGCSSLTSIEIPDGVQIIDRTTFQGCTSLVSVKLPDSVTSIGGSAFRDCASLTSVTIPEGVTSIGGSAFRDCSSLTSVTIPEGVTSIGYNAFEGCSSLTAFSLPASVTTMPESALPPSSNNLKTLEVAPDSSLYCTENNILYNKDKTKILCVARGGIAGALTLPSTLTSIPASAFRGCSALTSVTIPDSVTSIEGGAFYQCSSLTSVTIPEGVTSIGYNAFEGCSSLTSVTIPEGITSVPSRAFYGCSSLVSVVLPESLVTIRDRAFQGCTALESVVIPKNVTTIEEGAFYRCETLTVVEIQGNITTSQQNIFLYCSSLKTAIFRGDVPNGLSSWGLNRNIILYSKEYSANWKAFLGNLSAIVEIVNHAGVTARAEMPTPKTMMVTYSVKSEKAKVKVRAVAFKDGVRSFANVVPVKSGTDVPNGAEVTANEEHTFVWNISEDWAIDLAKVAVEILVEEGTLLPQELITIPGAPMSRADMTITRNTLSEAQAFDALLWCYAEGDAKVVIEAGKVKIDNKLVAEGTSIVTWDGSKWFSSWQGSANSLYVTGYVSTLLNYLYGKMGYKVLSGEDYTYAKAATRLNLAKEGLGQVSVKIAETAKE